VQQQISGRIEAVCQAFIIADTDRHFRAVRNRVLHEHSLGVSPALSDQRRLDVAIEESRQHFQDSGAPAGNYLPDSDPRSYSGQMCKLLSIVAPITTVEVLMKAAFPPEQGRAVDEPDGQPTVRQAGRDDFREAGIRDVQFGLGPLLGRDTQGARVAGQNETNIHAEPCKGLWECRADVRQSTGLGEWGDHLGLALPSQTSPKMHQT
jgi:hypothetical protein